VKIINNSNSYMPHCGGCGWGVRTTMNDVVYYRYLAKSTTWNQFLLIAYIVFLTKMQKGKPCGMDLPVLKR